MATRTHPASRTANHRAEGAANVVVANAGHVPWMSFGAEALDERGALRWYCAPAATTTEDETALARLPGPLGSLARAELQRRQVTNSLPVRRVATGFEIAAVLARRVAPSGRLNRAFADARDLRFDMGVSRLLRGDDAAAYLTFGACLRTIRRGAALGVKTLVEQAVHHHRYVAAILQDEARRQPDYADSLQFHRPGARRVRILDSELAEADRVVALSTFSKQTYVDAGVPADRVLVNPLGVEVEAFSRVERRDDDDFRVLFLGVLTQRKGISYLVEGFRRAELPGGELLLVGSPIGRGQPWRMTRGVRQRPWVDRGELPDLFSRCDVLVLPSLVEGFARVVVEAMAAGLPVIVTPNSGAADAVSDGVEGYVVPLRDADAIAERLRSLCRDPDERRRMGTSARRRAADFSWRRYGERVAEMTTAG